MERNDIPCSVTGKLTIVKMSILPNLIYTFNEIPIKIPASCLANINKQSKVFMESKSPRIANIILKKNNIGEQIDFKICSKATVIRTAWYRVKNGHTEQWRKIEPRNIFIHILSTDL